METAGREAGNPLSFGRSAAASRTPATSPDESARLRVPAFLCEARRSVVG